MIVRRYVLESMERFAIIEKVLASDGVFGDSLRIREGRHLAYRSRLEQLSAHLPQAEMLRVRLVEMGWSRIGLLAGNIVVRAAIDDALVAIASGDRQDVALKHCRCVLDIAADGIENVINPGFLGFGFGELLYPEFGEAGIAVWSVQEPETVYGRTFKRLLEDRLAEIVGERAALCDVGPDDVAKLTRAISLLRGLVPSLAASALFHTDMLVVFPSEEWGNGLSLSQARLGGAIFMSREILDNPWRLAEQIFHESLHQKLYDFRCACSVLEPGVARTARVRALWNIQGGEAQLWNTSRTLTAFHVYVHLGLFGLKVEAGSASFEEEFGLAKASGVTSSRTALQRARYLSRSLAAQCWGELAVAGRRLVEWLTDILDVLEDAPALAGDHLHLLLDRYLREPRVLVTASGMTSSVAHSEMLAALARDEVQVVQSVMGVLVSDDAAGALGRSLGGVDGDGAELLLRSRLLIAEALQDAVDDRSGSASVATERREARKILEQMIERSTLRIQAIA